MKPNPLQELHEQAEAAFIPYGPDIAIVESYGEPEAEYAAIRKAAALMDAPQRGTIELRGRDRLTFLNNLVTNDTRTLVSGSGRYAFMLNTRGRIVADMNVLNLADRTLLDMDARLTAATAKALGDYIFTEDVSISDRSTELARLSLFGPAAAHLLDRIGAVGIESDLASPLHIKDYMLADIPVAIFSLNLVGSPQYELITPVERVRELWQILLERGDAAPAALTSTDSETKPRLRAIGWSAFNVARIESGSLLLGIDISEHNLPMETGPWYLRGVSLTKGCYLGQEVVARMHSHNSVARMLVGLRFNSHAPPMAGAELRAGELQVGMVTSSCNSPMLGSAPIGLGYVKRSHSELGGTVETDTMEGHRPATITALPFWLPPGALSNPTAKQNAAPHA
ncbi:MAG: YgfZ/GcvT domain-containing protein [Phycisphaerae bacterium]